MGYYTDIVSLPSVRDECVDDVRKLLKDMKDEVGSAAFENNEENAWKYELSCWELPDGSNRLDTSEWNAKWYEIDVWLGKLAPYLGDGDILCVGEDSSVWGYIIKNGKVINAEVKLVPVE